jgi:hypothetical protein
MTAENQALHEKIVREQKEEIVQAVKRRRQNAMLACVGSSDLESDARG